MSELRRARSLSIFRIRRAWYALSRVAVLALVASVLLAAGSSQTASSALLTSTATDVSSGSYHSCAVLSDGTTQCWGMNTYGQLGDGTTTDRSTPVVVSGVASATQVSSGHWHSCARLSDGVRPGSP
jgi:alpha-tubulin suppressor-like RCC1 family protein